MVTAGSVTRWLSCISPWSCSSHFLRQPHVAVVYPDIRIKLQCALSETLRQAHGDSNAHPQLSKDD